MKKVLGIGLVTALAAIAAPASAATIVRCTVTNSGALSAVLAGNGYSITNANSGGTISGAISCPLVSAGAGIISNYKVFGITDFQNADGIVSPSSTVTQTLTLVGGALNNAAITATSTGQFSSAVNNPANPFQIGSTLGGASSYAAFTVSVLSSVTAGGPVGNSGGQVYLSYDVVPEPATWALMMAGFGLTGAAMRRKKMSLSYA